MENFADKLISEIKQKRSYVCAGIDLQVVGKEFIPRYLFEEQLNQYSPPSGKPRKEDILRAAAEAVKIAGKKIVRAVAPYTSMIKLQLAYYEALGTPGLEAMVEILRYAEEIDPGLVKGTDSKRNDIDRTAQKYAQAHIGKTPLPLDEEFEFVGADITTVNGFLGLDGVKPFTEFFPNGKGIFVLVDTSNKSKVDFQNLLVLQTNELLDLAVKVLDTPTFTIRKLDDAIKKESVPADLKLQWAQLRSGIEDVTIEPNYVAMARLVQKWSAGTEGKYGYSPMGAVVGATWPYEGRVLRQILRRNIELLPGFDTQGGMPEEVPTFLNDDGQGVIASSSSGIDYAYMRDRWKNQFKPEEFDKASESEAKRLRDAINVAAEEKGLIKW